MTRFALPLAASLLLSACAVGPRNAPVTCDTAPASGCSFDRAPLRVLPEPVTLPRRPWTFFPTAHDLNFTDARGGRWTAPEGTLTDGASIPRFFVSIIGDPTDQSFINAAAMHDAYCGVGNERGPKYQTRSWEETHLMFYDGLITGGAQPVIAERTRSSVS